MNARLLVAVMLVVGCGGASGHDVRTPATGGDAGAEVSVAGAIESGGAEERGGSGGALPAERGGDAGAVPAPGGSVSDGGEDPEAGGAQPGGGAGEAGAETGGSVATGGDPGGDGGEATGGVSATGGAPAGPCTWVCVTDTRYYSYPGSNSHQSRSYSYNECPSVAPETTSCSQGAGYSVAVACSTAGTPTTDCEPWPDGGTGGAGGTGGSATGGAATGGTSPLDSGTWVLDGTCVRLQEDPECPFLTDELCGGCSDTALVTCQEYYGAEHVACLDGCVECGDNYLNCDGRDWFPGSEYSAPYGTLGCEVGISPPLNGEAGPTCAEAMANPERWTPCVTGYWGIDPSGAPCGDTCLACIPVCAD